MKSKSILFGFMALVSSVVTQETSEIEKFTDYTPLRGNSPSNRYEEDSDRNLIFLCNIITGLFNQEVNCKCTNRFLFGQLQFDCVSKDFSCADLPVAGAYCGKTSFKGKFNWFLFQLKTAVSFEACQKASWANNTIGGDVKVGDVCLEFGLTGRLLGPSGVSACKAKLGTDVTCETCTTCKYDVPNNNRTGTELKCNTWKVKPCFPFEVPGIVQGREKEQDDPLTVLKSIDPQALTFGTAYDYAVQVVEEKAAEFNRKI